MSAVERPLAGMLVAICDACWPSNVRRTRALELATGVEQPCGCGSDCGRNRRARGAA